MHPLISLLDKPERLVVGLMSGTSADGVDAVLCRIRGCGTGTKVEQLSFYFQPFDDETRSRILQVAGGDFGGSKELCLLSFRLGQIYTEAVEKLMAQAGVDHIDLIGTHGQTVYHIPEALPYVGAQVNGTLQIGEPSILAERFGCPVVSDFRVRDMAAGGLGAPLVPYTEFLLYRSETEDVALQNIGGIGNITLLQAGCALEDVTAFDTGPGNMIMDALISRMTNGRQTYDDGGKVAARGRVNPVLLAWMLDDPYLDRQPPKTTGREYYGEDYVSRLMIFAMGMNLSPVDTLATATYFTAKSIELSLRKFASRMPARLVVGGGGSRNPTLLKFLQELLPEVQVQTQEDLGLDSDSKEAVAFAILANEAVSAVPNNAPGATGAKHPVVMGKISF